MPNPHANLHSKVRRGMIEKELSLMRRLPLIMTSGTPGLMFMFAIRHKALRNRESVRIMSLKQVARSPGRESRRNRPRLTDQFRCPHLSPVLRKEDPARQLLSIFALVDAVYLLSTQPATISETKSPPDYTAQRASHPELYPFR